MAKSQVTYNKKEKEKKRLKKQKEKQQKREERKANPKSSLDDMIAYVDEHGNITDTPPDPANRVQVDASTIEVSVRKKEKDESVTIMKGKVEYFDSSRGFGFIRHLDTQEKYFVHVSELLEEIKENDTVIFELERGMKGMNAVRVKKA
jgi:cold shock CspA family protein